jgi:type IV secretion system protein VirB8
MNEHSHKLLDAYYKEAGSWNSDRLKAMRSSRRTAWLVATAATVVAVLEAGALILLTPLKTVEPYTLLVDKTTGYVQPLRPLEPSKMAPDTALTQSFLVQYVIARESFDFAEVRANYRKVALLSGEGARTSYLTRMQPSNPQSPLVIYPRGTIIETRVKSISPIGNDAVLVRFDTVRTDANGRAQPPMPWVSLVRFKYSAEQMKLEDRFVNPLGFQVVQYRRDPEALPPPEPRDDGSAAAAATPAGSAPLTAPALLPPSAASATAPRPTQPQ